MARTRTWSGEAIPFEDIERLVVGKARRDAQEEGIQLERALGTNFNVDVISRDGTSTQIVGGMTQRDAQLVVDQLQKLWLRAQGR